MADIVPGKATAATAIRASNLFIIPPLRQTEPRVSLFIGGNGASIADVTFKSTRLRAQQSGLFQDDGFDGVHQVFAVVDRVLEFIVDRAVLHQADRIALFRVEISNEVAIEPVS